MSTNRIVIYFVFFFVFPVNSFSFNTGGTTCGGSGCRPIEKQAREVFDFLILETDEELSHKLSDPDLCKTISCLGLTTIEVQNTIKNIFEARRFEKTQQQAKETQSQTFYLALVSIVIALGSLLIASLAFKHNRQNSKST